MTKKKDILTLVLAAGLGTRMKAPSLPKVLHQAGGKPLLYYPLATTSHFKPKKTVVVTSPGQESIKSTIAEILPKTSIEYVIQNPPQGTGHAVMMTEKAWNKFDGDILILCGDMALVTKESYDSFLSLHQNEKATLTFMTAVMPEAGNYGRIFRSPEGRVCSIIEARDCSNEQAKIREVNAGIYLVNATFLRKALKEIKNNNAQKEYYLTDIVKLAFGSKEKIETFKLKDWQESLGVNTQIELTHASEILVKRRIEKLSAGGVHFVTLENIVIDDQVSIGSGTTIYPPVTILGKTSIGNNCIIEPNNFFKQATVGNHCHLKANNYIDDSILGDKVAVGPFAHLRPGTKLANKVKIGNFVETKKAVVDEGSKINHLSYIGDATIGKHVNIGAGTITCNYDGINKFKTVLEDDVFVGSDTQFVAPVTVKKGAFIGAGSTITKNVSAGALSFSRSPQVEKAGWGKKRMKK